MSSLSLKISTQSHQFSAAVSSNNDKLAARIFKRWRDAFYSTKSSNIWQLMWHLPPCNSWPLHSLISIHDITPSNISIPPPLTSTRAVTKPPIVLQYVLSSKSPICKKQCKHYTSVRVIDAWLGFTYNWGQRFMMADQYTGVMGRHPQSITIHRCCILNRQYKQIVVWKSTKKHLVHCHTSHKLPGTSERSFLIAISDKGLGEWITSISINVTIKFGLHKKCRCICLNTFLTREQWYPNL